MDEKERVLMKFRQFGRTTMNVSELGLGTMSLPTERNEVERVIDTALDAGMNYIDTADLYDFGQNEEVVGAVIRKKRNDIFLATKVGNKMNPTERTWTWDPSRKHIMEGVKESLRRLGTDYIDLYQLHGGTIEDNTEETIDAFEQLKKEGIIRAYGISSIRPNVIHRFLETSAIDSIMMQYSPLDRQPENYFPMIAKKGVSVITRGSVAKGLLTKQMRQKQQKLQTFASFNEAELNEALDIIEAIHENTQALALRFILEERPVTTALVGSRTAAQLEETLRAYEESQTDDIQQAVRYLRIALPRHEYENHLIDEKYLN